MMDGLKALDTKAYADALRSFDDAYRSGDPDGAFFMGRMIELGIGTAPDFDRALALYKSASEQGSARAMNRLGVMAWRGEQKATRLQGCCRIVL